MHRAESINPLQELMLMLRRSGTAWCALGSFGGGFLGGDEVDVSVEVGQNAVLGLTTQAGPWGDGGTKSCFGWVF